MVNLRRWFTGWLRNLGLCAVAFTFDLGSPNSHDSQSSDSDIVTFYKWST